jgi:simple sugar transport system ATP-binding protein
VSAPVTEDGAAAREAADALDDAPETPMALVITAAKAYGACVALADATLIVPAGTIHAVVGENGAGKSTLLRLAFGLERIDRGRIAIGGRGIDPARHTPRLARAAGLGLVQQHGALVPSLTVAENAALLLGRGALVDVAGPAAAIAARGAALGLAVEPHARVADLPVGVAQRAEILIALCGGARILALDEPTALLTPAETDALLAALRRLRADGATVILVTHKLDEVRAVADAITVLRAGRTVAAFTGDAPADRIARAMVGAEVVAAVAPPRPFPGAAPVLALRGVSRAPLAEVSLAVGPGEIVGVAGVEGNGQRELVAAIAGLGRATGTITLGGADLGRASVAARRAAGLALIPEDRHRDGLVLGATVADNLALGRLAELSPGVRLDRARLDAHARALCRDFDVRPPDPTAITAALSGGNQQKLVVARELTRPGVRIVIAAQPTRGVDLAASALIHARLGACAAAGAGVLLISADLDELLALAHRIVVLYRGRIVGALDDLAAADARARIGALMTGAAA